MNKFTHMLTNISVNLFKKPTIGLVVAYAALMSSSTVLATNGFLGHCVGPFNCATAGAGAANPTSAVDALINPSLIAKQDNNFVIDARVMHVDLNMDTSSALLGNKVGKQTSRLKDFPDFSMGASYKITEDINFALAMAASGGMATKYSSPRTSKDFQIQPPFDTKAMYRLAHMSPAISWQVRNDMSAGMSLLVGYSDFKTDSARATPLGLVQTSGSNKRQSAWGYGGRLGIVWDANEIVTFGASYAAPVFFQKFTKYNDILLGPINTPMNFVIGSTWHLAKNTDALLDIKRVFYKKVKAIGKEPVNGGFGWSNQTILMMGVTQHYDKWSGSLGYSYAKSPIAKDKIFANGLFPAIVEQHFTAGLGYKILEGTELRLGGFYVPKKTLIDPGTGDIFSKNGKGTKISMSQYGLFLGAKHNF